MTASKFDWSSVGGRPAPKAQAFDWSSVGGRPHTPKEKQVQAPMEEKYPLKALQEQHPLLYKIAEHFQGSPGLQQAGDIAGHINNTVEGTGLPSIARGFLGTGVNMGRGLANLIPGVNVQEQKLPELNVNPYVGQGAETIGSLGMGLPAYRGYQAAKKGIEAIPHATKIPELLRNLLSGGATGAAISPEHRGLGATIGAGAEIAPAAIRGVKNYVSNRNPIAKERDLYKAIAEHEMQKRELQSAKALAKHKFKMNDPEALELNAEEKSRELVAKEAYKKNYLPEEKMLPGEQLIPEAEYGVKNVNDVLKHTLGEGEPHSQKLSKHIVEAIEGVPTIEPHPKTGLPRVVRIGGERKAWGAKMDELENNLPEVELPGSTDMKAVEKELESLIGEKSNLSDEQKESFRKVLAKTHPSGKNKTINGKEFFRSYRSMKTLEGEQRSKAFGLSPKDHDEWIARANKTKDTYEKMEKIIHDHFPEDTMKIFHELNHEYSTKIAPLHENPMYQQMKEHGRYSAGMVEPLSGTTKGNDILNRIIQNDPELTRLLLGHEFAGNPEKLLKPNQNVDIFSNANPEIKRLLGLQKEAQGQLETAKETARIREHIKNLPELRNKIKEQRAMAKKIKNESEVRGLTKAELEIKKHEYEKAQQKLNKMLNKVLFSGLGTAGVYAANKVRD